jgi:serine/threonine protein kinase
LSSSNVNSMIGKEYGGYRLLRLLGSGAMGAVFLGEQVNNPGRFAAIKVLILPWNASPEDIGDFQTRFRREAQALLGLNHPHIPRIIGFGEDGDVYYLILQYIDGGTLTARIRQQHGPLPYQEATRYIQQLADALDYAHSQRIVHRDIKPANVLLDNQGNAYLADFSIVQILGSLRGKLTATGYAIGTPEFMSPEQAAGKPVNALSDIYSLGLLAYLMVTGRLPFESGSAVHLGIQHIQEAPPSPRQFRPDLHPAVEAVILKALAKRPEDRFTSAGAFSRALLLSLQGQYDESLTTWVSPRAPQRSTASSMLLPTVMESSRVKPPSQTSALSQFLRNPISVGVSILLIIVLCVVIFAHGLGGNNTTSSPTTGTQSTPTSSTTLTPALTPTPTFSPTSAAIPTSGLTPTPASTSVPTPVIGQVLYRANWSSGLNGWVGGGEWKVLNGTLINDGTSNNNCGIPSIVPPYQPTVSDYAIEVRMQVVRRTGSGNSCFALNARSGSSNGQTIGYIGNVGCCGDIEIYDASNYNQFIRTNFDPSGNWHTYRFEVKGTDLKILIDGSVIAEASDAKYLGFSGQVGLSDETMYVNVSSFAVYAV